MTTPTDLNRPIADLLRAGTAAAHQNVETSRGAVSLTRGELDREEYVRFLIMLYNVYDTLETALEKHAANPVLAPTYNPPLLARAPALLSDISHILGHPLATIHSHPLVASLAISPSFTSSSSAAQSLSNLKNIPAGLEEYVSRLSTLAVSPDPAPLLAHAYVRYLGDLSGGQQIKRRVQKAYGLEEDEGLGVAFYEFGKLGGDASRANMGDMKKIKEWYRDGMNAGVGDDKDLKVTIVAEANKAFELNQGLFASLRAPSTPPSNSPSPHPANGQTFLGDPMSPTVPDQKSPFEKAQDQYEPREKPIEILQTRRNQEPMVSIAGVVSFLLALSIAHAALTIGGFTGARGWAKLEAVEEWVAGIFGY